MPDPSTVSASPSGSPLSHSNFRDVWTGQFISQIGSSAHAVGVAFFLKEATESATFVGGALFVTGFAALLCLPIAGITADRRNRKHIVLICDAIGAVATFILACALLLAPAPMPEWLPYLVVLGSLTVAVSSAFFRPAFGALLPDLVPRNALASANSLYKTGARLGDLVGTTCGGIIYRFAGPGNIFIGNAVSYLISVIFVSRAKPDIIFAPSPATDNLGKQTEGLYDNFIKGVSTLTKIPGGRLFLSMALVINFFATPIFVLMPFHVSNVLHGQASLYGALMASLSLGILTGYFFAAKFSLARTSNSTTIVAIIVLMCAAFVIFAQATSPTLALIALFIAGIANGYWSIFFETSLQSTIPRDALGRVYACYGMLSGGLVPLSSLLGGIILDFIGQDTVLLFSICAAFMTAYPLLLLSRKNFTSFFDHLRRANKTV
ncbi:MFS transporter [Bordetella trematum]|uniref:MFS transporter n=1 Tax=Bordetella trematum TaxID=123899 RepID=UPI001405541B|nr:MFS transporter [Bordetella trematum]QIM71273.1 MFS transporter [Bordetella trematum]